MSRNDKINLLISLSNEVDFFVNEVRNFIPSLLTDRYQMTSIDYTDTLLSIVELEKPLLEQKIKKVYDDHLNEDELDSLIILCGLQTKVEIDPTLYDALEDTKDFWFDSFIFKADLIMNQIQSGDFSN